ncbi:MAG: hypothetical protein QQN45_03745 [Nitrosopumilus sp.]
MRDDYAEYTQCPNCITSLLDCNCNCFRCGKREECKCELSPLAIP